MNYRDEVEIDLIDLLHYLLLKWRSVIVCMLVGMILMGAYGYNKKIPVVIDEKGEKVDIEPVDEKSLAALGSKLSANEKREVVLAVDSYLEYEKSYADRQRVGESMITLKYDAFNVPKYMYNYRISDYSFQNVPDSSAVTNVDNIVTMYKNAIWYDGSVLDEIKRVNSWDCEDGFVRQLYSVVKSDLDMMQLTVTAPTKDECENIIKILDRKINEVSPVVKGQYFHRIERIQELYVEYYDSEILDLQKGQIDTLISIEKTMQQVPSAMTADQKAYYTALLNTVKEESQQGNVTDTLSIAKREAGKENEVLKALNEASAASSASTVADKANESEQNVIMVPAKQISAKHIVIGAFAGIFVMLCIYGSLYVFSPKLRTMSDMQGMFRVSVLGDIRDENRYNKSLSGVDRLIDSFFEKKEGQLSTSEKMELITSSICLALKKIGAKSIYITGVGADKRSEDFKGRLVSCIEKSDVNEGGFSLSTGASPLLNSDSLKNLTSSDSVILVEQVGSSRYDDVAKMIELCNKFEVKVLGTVVLSR